MHWTYEPVSPERDLEQGDLVAPSPRLRSILTEVHPHFCDSKYLGFMVATQSCDLVRRDGKAPKADYISLVTVRSLRSVLNRLVASVAKDVFSLGAYRRSHQVRARELLERIFEQNEQALGLFYLHPDPDIAIGEAAVAFLRVSVALRAEHYDSIVAARTGGLRSDFRAKLGWLLGNLYGRPASPDWADAGQKRDRDDQIKDLLGGPDEDLPRWVDDEVVDAALAKKFVRDAAQRRDDVLASLEVYRPKPPITTVVDEVSRVLIQVLAPEKGPPEHQLMATDAAEAAAEKLRGRLEQNKILRKYIKT